MTDEQFINQLYTKGFGRDIDAAGAEYWKEQLSLGESRTDLLSSFANSEEAMTNGFDLSNVRLFANGGIANEPSIFGEAGAEAAVPLPDGRSIPVTLSGDSEGSKEIIELLKQLIQENRDSTDAMIESNFNSTEQGASAIIKSNESNRPTKIAVV